MKIVHCIFALNTGGAETITVDILNELCLAHDVSLIIVNNLWNDALLQKLNKKVSIYRINRKVGSRNPISLMKLNLLLKILKPDVVHCHQNKLINLLFFRSFKSVFTIHCINADISDLRKYNVPIAISDSVADDVWQRSGVKIKTVHNGIPIKDFRARKNYFLDKNETIRIVQISRLMHETKGQDILIKALDKLIKEKNLSNVTLDFIGSGESLEYLMSLRESLDLKTKINFLGEKDRTWIQENLADYHILVQPSRYEGFGLTVVEGLAAGLPVAVSDNDGPSEIMKEIKSDFIFRKNDDAACADALFRIIELYKSNRIIDITQNARKVIKNRYSIKSTVSKYLQLYDALV